MNKYYSITVDGAENISAAEKFIGANCTKDLLIHGRRIAQAEIVIPFGECGYRCSDSPFGLVSFSYILPANVGKVLDSIKRLGFSGIALVSEESENECFVKTLSCFATVI